MAIKFQGGKKATKGSGSKPVTKAAVNKTVRYGGSTTGGGSEALQNSWERREKAADPYAIQRYNQNPRPSLSGFDALRQRAQYNLANAAPGSPLSWINQLTNRNAARTGATPAAAQTPYERFMAGNYTTGVYNGPIRLGVGVAGPWETGYDPLTRDRTGYSNATHEQAAYYNNLYGLTYGGWSTPIRQEAKTRQNASPIGYEWTPTHGWIPAAQGQQTGAAETPMEYAGGVDYGYEDWPMDWGDYGGGGGGGGYTYDPQTQSWYLNPYTWRI